MITVQTVLHSRHPGCPDLITQQLRYPRLMHSEYMTHRKFSRNARSSRAVPSATLLKEDVYVPQFLENKPGMVGGLPLTPENQAEAERIWLKMARACQEGVAELDALNVHKQHKNRPLEWFGYIDVLVTSTDWANFDALRDDDGAQPEIRALAREMRRQREMSVPQTLNLGEWHLPYITNEEIEQYGGREDPTGTLCILSTARCARLTIKPFDGKGDLESERARFERLTVSRPVHASPAEHQASPDPSGKDSLYHGNFRQWVQFRKFLPFESVKD